MIKLAESLDGLDMFEAADRLAVRLAMRPVRPGEVGEEFAPHIKEIGRQNPNMLRLTISPELMSRLDREWDPAMAGKGVLPKGFAVHPRDTQKSDYRERQLQWDPDLMPTLRGMLEQVGRDDKTPVAVTRSNTTPWVARHEVHHLESGKIDRLLFPGPEDEVVNFAEQLLSRYVPDRRMVPPLLRKVFAKISSNLPSETFANLKVLRDFVLAKGVTPPKEFSPDVSGLIPRLAAWISKYMPNEMGPEKTKVYLENLLRIPPNRLAIVDDSTLAYLAWETSRQLVARNIASQPILSPLGPVVKSWLSAPRELRTDAKNVKPIYSTLPMWDPAPVVTEDKPQRERREKKVKPTGRPQKSKRRF